LSWIYWSCKTAWKSIDWRRSSRCSECPKRTAKSNGLTNPCQIDQMSGLET
jgi:hypothetical protein